MVPKDMMEGDEKEGHALVPVVATVRAVAVLYHQMAIKFNLHENWVGNISSA